MALKSINLARAVTYGVTKSPVRTSPCLRASSSGTDLIWSGWAIYSLAYFPICAVRAASAGPPVDGLYFKPISWGGLWLAVPFNEAHARPFRISKENTGVGSGISGKITGRPFPASTSVHRRAVSADIRRVSPPTKTGPVKFCSLCKRATAWAIARACSAQNPAPNVPRCPEVPNFTGTGAAEGWKNSFFSFSVSIFCVVNVPASSLTINSPIRPK